MLHDVSLDSDSGIGHSYATCHEAVTVSPRLAEWHRNNKLLRSKYCLQHAAAAAVFDS